MCVYVSMSVYVKARGKLWVALLITLHLILRVSLKDLEAIIRLASPKYSPASASPVQAHIDAHDYL